jgi:ABC-type amino acid transport substrate-binding protein
MKTLRVGAAFPDPPFNGMPSNAGLDIDLMTAIAQSLGAAVEFIQYAGADFNGIFDTTRLPNVTTIDDLHGLTIGVQQGNTSQPIADRLVAEGKAASVRVYDYGSIRTALTDLTTGACDAFMKLAPVLTELVMSVPGVEVVQRGISVENIAIAVALGDHSLVRHITAAQDRLERDGMLQRIRRKWLGNGALEQSVAMR